MLHSFDANRWIGHCLPPILRQPVLVALFKCCIQPIRQLHERYIDYAAQTEIQIVPRSSGGLLTHWLNSLFGLPYGAIFIQETADTSQYLFYDGEMPAETYLYTQEEGYPLYLHYLPVGTFEGFVVKVPASVATESNLKIIEKWVQYYKIAGVQYKIVVYE